MAIWPVVLCGGSGTRLWPCSTGARPKQFFAFTGGRTLFEDTVLRVVALEPNAKPIIVTNIVHVGQVREQMAGLGIDAVILAEPVGRDSAPAIAAAAAYVASQDPEGVVVAVASDHLIPDGEAFRAAALRAVEAARGGAITIFGVRPTEPATAYGYIQAADRPGPSPGVAWVERFVEKPDAERAVAYIDAGYLWNSGNFVFPAAVMLAELDARAPGVSAAAREAVATAAGADGELVLGPAFEQAPRVSIDYAVMEKTDRAAVLPVDYAWSDLGAWDAVLAARTADADVDGNATEGEVMVRDSHGSLIRAASGVPVVAVGLRDIAVVAEPHGILVCALGAAQSVKQAVDALPRRPSAPADLGELSARLDSWLKLRALPLWWSLGADHVRGGFHERIDQDGTPRREPSRIRVQARQVDVFATAARLGWEGPWAAAVEHGLDALQARYRRDDGYYRALAGPDGAVLDDGVLLYDQAFVLLAMASAAAVLPARRAELEATAADLLAAIRRDMAWPAGGFAERGPVPALLANPLMHLFEAALAWDAVSPDGDWGRLADDLARLAMDRLIQPDGSIREIYDAEWRPEAGSRGDGCEPGHQLEWAWLLTRWGRRRGDPSGEAAARRLYETGGRGLDPVRGVMCNAISSDGRPLDSGARLWPQTEWLKAALVLGDEAAAIAAATALLRYLDTPAPGLWRDRLTANGTFVEEPAPASSFYHIATAIAALAEPTAGASREGQAAPSRGMATV